MATRWRAKAPTLRRGSSAAERCLPWLSCKLPNLSALVNSDFPPYPPSSVSQHMLSGFVLLINSSKSFPPSLLTGAWAPSPCCSQGNLRQLCNWMPLDAVTHLELKYAQTQIFQPQPFRNIAKEQRWWAVVKENKKWQLSLWKTVDYHCKYQTAMIFTYKAFPHILGRLPCSW